MIIWVENQIKYNLQLHCSVRTSTCSKGCWHIGQTRPKEVFKAEGETRSASDCGRPVHEDEKSVFTKGVRQSKFSFVDK